MTRADEDRVDVPIRDVLDSATHNLKICSLYILIMVFEFTKTALFKDPLYFVGVRIATVDCGEEGRFL